MFKRSSGYPWFDTFFARKTMEKVPPHDLRGKVVVLSGATDGMGRVAADRFAEMGADLLVLGRNRGKTRNVVKELLDAGHPGNIESFYCDLSSLQSVRGAAEEVLGACDKIDFLINCAGINNYERQNSVDGLEMNMAVNYFGSFLLVELLLPRMKVTPSSRIVNVTSAMQLYGHLNFDDLNVETDWSMFKAYAQAKLCMIMHTRDISHRFCDKNPKAVSLNPGFIHTNLLRDSSGLAGIFKLMSPYIAAPAWVGAERIILAALDSTSNSGDYVYEDEVLLPNPEALDDQAVDELMKISRKVVLLDQT